jgi:hypothetical protein
MQPCDLISSEIANLNIKSFLTNKISEQITEISTIRSNDRILQWIKVLRIQQMNLISRQQIKI